MTPYEAIGWLGTATYLLAYALLAGGIIGRGRLYFALNAAAAAAVTVVAASTATWQAVAINALWAAISVLGWLGVAPPVGRVSPRFARLAVAALAAAGLAAWGLGALAPRAPAALAAVPLAAVGVALLGWAAVAAFLLAYALFVARRVGRLEFHLWNLFAALAILPQVAADGNAPVLVLESAWALAAAVGWWRDRGAAA